MAKLYFRHGCVSSAKSLRLLAVAHNYEKQGKKVVVLKPRLDDRFGDPWLVMSRAPLERTACHLLGEHPTCTDVHDIDLEGVSCVLVDEAQFLTEQNIVDLRSLTFVPGVPVICYGLRTDFLTNLFPASKRLMELADTIEEVKTTCQFCNRKAVFNMRFRMTPMKEAGKEEVLIHEPILEGEQVELGADELYAACCYGCYPHNNL